MSDSRHLHICSVLFTAIKVELLHLSCIKGQIALATRSTPCNIIERYPKITGIPFADSQIIKPTSHRRRRYGAQEGTERAARQACGGQNLWDEGGIRNHKQKHPLRQGITLTE